jgi:hypothetical protein
MRNVAILLGYLAVLASAPCHADVAVFATPSGNIQCSAGTGEGPADVSCTIFERTGPTARPDPFGCMSNYGHHFILYDRGEVEMPCEDLPPKMSRAPKAAYGDQARFGEIRCTSSKAGFECRNADGHGFFLSRARQTVF